MHVCPCRAQIYWLGRAKNRPGRSLASAHQVILEIAIATVGDAGSATAQRIAFSVESILRRVCLVD